MLSIKPKNKASSNSASGSLFLRRRFKAVLASFCLLRRSVFFFSISEISSAIFLYSALRFWYSVSYLTWFIAQCAFFDTQLRICSAANSNFASNEDIFSSSCPLFEMVLIASSTEAIIISLFSIVELNISVNADFNCSSLKWGVEHLLAFLNFLLHCHIVFLYWLVECQTLLP